MRNTRTDSGCSLSVRMNRSAQPLPSGARTNAGARLDAQEPELGLEVVAPALAAMIVSEGQPRRHAGRHRPKARPHPLPDRPERRGPGGAAGGVDADPIGRAVVHGDEDRREPLLDRPDARRAGAPHRVGPVGGYSCRRGRAGRGRAGRARAPRAAPPASAAARGASTSAPPGGAGAPRPSGAPRRQRATPRALRRSASAARHPSSTASAGPAWTPRHPGRRIRRPRERLEQATPSRRAPRARPERRPVVGEVAWLMPSTGSRPKGRSPDAAPPPARPRCPSSARRPSGAGAQARDPGRRRPGA